MQITQPGARGATGKAYWSTGVGGQLLSMYGGLLGMRRIDIGYKKLALDGSAVEMGFERGPHNRRPQWPDPELPQQVHLDIEVGDLDWAESVVVAAGATRLRDNGEFRIFADPVGHPLCLYLDPPLVDRDESLPLGRIARVLFDCFSPRSLATFYEQLMDMPTRVLDTPERVVITGPGDRGPMLAFQHAQFPAARWPDPAYPQQIHLDLGFDDFEAAKALTVQLGGRCLRPDRNVFADPAAHPFCLGDMEEPDPNVEDVHRQWRAAQGG